MARGRKRRWAGWAILLMSVAAAALFVASRWLRFDAASPLRWQFTFHQGVFTAVRLLADEWALDPPRPWQAEVARSKREPELQWWLNARRADRSLLGLATSERSRGLGPSLQEYRFVVWPPIALATAVSLGLLGSAHRQRTRARTGVCPSCRYPRTGLPPATPCPECGHTALHQSPGAQAPGLGSRLQEEAGTQSDPSGAEIAEKKC